jgi:DNA-binding NarL/FixJ family response regulator
MSVELMLVDDHPIVRDGLRQRLEAAERFRVIGEAGNSEDALLIAAELKPKLALVDISLPGVDGIELTKKLREQDPALSVLIFSMYDDDDHIMRSVQAGASGYVLKDAPMAQLVAALAAIVAGGTYYPSSVVNAVTRPPMHSPLSPRERQVLDHLLDGYSNKDIARRLQLSVRTVETHRETIRRKLGAERMVDLVKQAVRFGLMRF